MTHARTFYALSGSLAGRSWAACPPAAQHSPAPPAAQHSPAPPAGGPSTCYCPWETGPQGPRAPSHPACPQLAPHAHSVTAVDGGAAPHWKHVARPWGVRLNANSLGLNSHPRGPGSKGLVLDSPSGTSPLFGHLKHNPKHLDQKS